MYARILVPLDGSALSEQVLAWVKVLAKGLKARVELLQVVEPVPRDLAGIASGLNTSDIEGQLVREADDYLNRLSSDLQGDGLSVTTNVQLGSPADCIADEVGEETDTLVAMTTHGRSGIQRWFLGSVTDKVLRSVTNPLLLVRASEPDQVQEPIKLETIIVPLDGSPLAEQIIPHTESLAKALRLKVLLARAVPSLGEYHQYMQHYPMGGSATVYSGMYEEFSREADALAMQYLHLVREQFTDHDLFSVQEKLLRGRAADAITDLAQETPNSLVSMTTHGHSGIGRWVLGSVTDRVVRQSGSPVLVIRAAGGEGPAN